MTYQFKELAKPVVITSAYRGDAKAEAKAEAKQDTILLNQLLDSGWRVWSTHTMTVGDVGYIVYVLRRLNKETEDVSNKQVE